MNKYEQMTDSEQRKLTFRYAEVMRFIQMRENGSYYLPEDMPSLDELRAELAEMDKMFQEEQPATTDAVINVVMTNNLRFFWNGIKAGNGKLQRASYSIGNLVNYPADTITIYAKAYTPFSDEIRAAFTVQNDSDGMTDYFETDRIRVTSSHPLYTQVLAALKARDAHYEKRFARVA